MSWCIRRAGTGDQEVVIDLIEHAATWLREKKYTDQWRRPWPDREGRDARVRDGLLRGRTWIALDRTRPAATITIDTVGEPVLWTEVERKADAVYLHRLVVHRDYTGTGMGADLIRWAAKRGRRDNPHADYVRLDAWSDNTELHDYYRRQGFELLGVRLAKEERPSAAVFQMPIGPALEADTSRLTETPPAPTPAGADTAAR